MLARHGDLNRVGTDLNHSVAVEPTEIASIDLQHSRRTRIGQFDLGLGFERLDSSVSGTNTREVRGYVQWQSR